MSKPVEIEFLMKDKLSDGIDNANAHIDTLIDNAKKAAELVNAKIAEQHKVIDGVSADLGRMERQLAGMKPGTAQKELAADVMACRKVLDEERNTLVYLEKQHRQAEKAVSDLEKEHGKLSESSTTAAVAQKTLAERIAESKDLVKYTTSCIKELEKAYKNAAPGNAQSAALAELNAAKKALEEEKLILASRTREQEENRESNKRLAMQLNGMNVIECPTKRSASSPSGFKQSDDIRLMLTTITMALKLRPDFVLLFAADGDFAPMVELLRNEGIRTEVVAPLDMLATDLRRYASNVVDFDALLDSIPH